MAHHQRGTSIAEAIKEPHSVSLKVLRLSRPSLSLQNPLPTPSPSPPSGEAQYPNPSASRAYPSTTFADPYILSPLLTLPPAFGSAYVGETFSCTLCANNEVLPGASSKRVISGVRIEAEMKIPSSAVPIPLTLSTSAEPDSSSLDEPRADEADEVTAEVKTGKEKDKGVDLDPGRSLQKIVNFDLKEEGSHVLAVTVTYSETTSTSGRIRTFRKLYQFVCKGCMVVRTKTGILPSTSGQPKWSLEAQLENCGDEIIILDTVDLITNAGFKSQGINWEVVNLDAGEEVERPVLGPGDVWQVAFIVEPDGEKQEVLDGRLIFGVLSIGWRGSMGNRGFLSTGNLGAKLK